MFARFTETKFKLQPSTAANRISVFPDADLVGHVESWSHQLDLVANRGFCSETGRHFLAVSIGNFRKFDLESPTQFFKLFGAKTDDGEVKYSGTFEVLYQPMVGEEIHKEGTVFSYHLYLHESFDADGNVKRVGGTGWPVLN